MNQTTQKVGKFLLSMMNPKTIVIAYNDQAVVASPAIRMDNAFGINFASHSALKHLFTRIWNNLGVDLSVPFKDAKGNGFTRGATASFAGKTSGAKVRFIHFSGTGKKSRLLTPLSNFTTQLVKNSVIDRSETKLK